MTVLLCIVFAVGLLEDSQKQEVRIARAANDVVDDIDAYYKNKYPDSHRLRAEEVVMFDDTPTPVYRITNSNPFGPYQTFQEQTEKSTTEILLTKVDIYSVNEGTSCRVVISSITLAKADSDFPYSTVDPITAKDIQDLPMPSQKKQCEPTCQDNGGLCCSRKRTGTFWPFPGKQNGSNTTDGNRLRRFRRWCDWASFVVRHLAPPETGPERGCNRAVSAEIGTDLVVYGGVGQ